MFSVCAFATCSPYVCFLAKQFFFNMAALENKFCASYRNGNQTHAVLNKMKTHLLFKQEPEKPTMHFDVGSPTPEVTRAFEGVVEITPTPTFPTEVGPTTYPGSPSYSSGPVSGTGTNADHTSSSTHVSSCLGTPYCKVVSGTLIGFSPLAFPFLVHFHSLIPPFIHYQNTT